MTQPHNAMDHQRLKVNRNMLSNSQGFRYQFRFCGFNLLEIYQGTLNSHLFNKHQK
jgi:hypothetical protein